MDDIILQAITKYYKILEKTGYFNYKEFKKVLVLCFYRDFVFTDYRGMLSREDYALIERALNCLFGSNCLIPYPDYLKMGKLHIGSITEMAHRLNKLENTKVVKAIDESNNAESDVVIIESEE
jgi:hypothetical protein